MKFGVILALLGVTASRHHHHHKHHSHAQQAPTAWTNGNGLGNEKVDDFWHKAHWAKSKDDFAHKVARETFIPSGNSADNEPPQWYGNLKMRRAPHSKHHSFH